MAKQLELVANGNNRTTACESGTETRNMYIYICNIHICSTMNMKTRNKRETEKLLETKILWLASLCAVVFVKRFTVDGC